MKKAYKVTRNRGRPIDRRFSKPQNYIYSVVLVGERGCLSKRRSFESARIIPLPQTNIVFLFDISSLNFFVLLSMAIHFEYIIYGLTFSKDNHAVQTSSNRDLTSRILAPSGEIKLFVLTYLISHRKTKLYDYRIF